MVGRVHLVIRRRSDRDAHRVYELILEYPHSEIPPLVGFAEVPGQQPLLGGASVNDFVYSNRNVMEQYPWLKFAKDLEYRGVRESAFPTGHNFNLRKVEKIIGLGVKNVMNQMMSMEEAIDYINARLSEKEFLA